MKNKKIIIVGISMLVILIIMVCLYFYGLTPVSKNSEKVLFTVGGSKRKVINDLYEAGLIKSKIASNIYIRLNKNVSPKAGVYELNRNSSTEQIFRTISSSSNSKVDTVKVTFIEGKRLVDYVKVISNNFDYSEDEILKTINDKEYLEELIKKYDFLTTDILNSDIYYPLEGYLFPATYEFFKDASIKQIIEKMLDKTKNVLDNIKADMAGKNVHEILTIASIIESESKFQEDRAKVSQVIYKRLDIKMNLGMDVTSYYGAKKALSETLTKSDLASKNAYNTRNTEFLGLPVGPICNPREDSIKAALNPSNTNYLYFYADVYGKDGKEYVGKLHFAETYNEFQSLIRKYS